MKVDSGKINQSKLGESTAAAGAKKPSTDKAGGDAKADFISALDNSSARVNVSDRARDAQKIREVVAGTPDVDEAKVAKFKALINSGKYQTDAKAIADKMVDEHLTMSSYASEE